METLNGIPNFDTVDPVRNIMRGGQPNDAGWNWLKTAGITSVVKLNCDAGEDTDVAAEALGMKLWYFPIPLIQQLLEGPTASFVNGAVQAIGDRTFVHCEHGQDRTGLCVAVWRMKQGWPKAQAEAEMLARGFHKELLGLWEYWEHHV